MWRECTPRVLGVALRYDHAMRESLTIQQIRCERCVNKIAQALGVLKGLNEARIEMGTSSVIVDYDDEIAGEVTGALEGAGFVITERRELAAV